MSVSQLCGTVRCGAILRVHRVLRALTVQVGVQQGYVPLVIS